MPINPKMKAIIEADTTMTPEYKATLIATFENAPAEFQNGWIAQQDYTRQVNAFKVEQTEWKTKADKFYTDSNKSIADWKAETDRAKEAKEAAEARIRELEAGGGAGGGGGAPTDAAMKEITSLKQILSGIEQKIGKVPEGVVTREQLNEEYKNVVGFLGATFIGLSNVQREHEKTFGTPLSEKEQEELLSHAGKMSNDRGGKAVPLADAYKDMYHAKLTEKQIEDAVAKRVEDFKTTHHVPNADAGGPGPGGPGKGPFEIRLDQLRNRDAGVKDGAGYATWQEAAAAAGDELVKDGKY